VYVDRIVEKTIESVKLVEVEKVVEKAVEIFIDKPQIIEKVIERPN
jgi:hypothetical protein